MRETVWAAEKIMVLPPCVKYRVRMESKKRWRWWWVNADKKKFFWGAVPSPTFSRRLRRRRRRGEETLSSGGGGCYGDGETRSVVPRGGETAAVSTPSPLFKLFFALLPCSRGKEKRGCVGSTGATVSSPPPAIQRANTMRPSDFMCLVLQLCL